MWQHSNNRLDAKLRYDSFHEGKTYSSLEIPFNLHQYRQFLKYSAPGRDTKSLPSARNIKKQYSEAASLILLGNIQTFEWSQSSGLHSLYKILLKQLLKNNLFLNPKRRQTAITHFLYHKPCFQFLPSNLIRLTSPISYTESNFKLFDKYLRQRSKLYGKEWAILLSIN